MNMIQTPRAPAPAGHYSQAVVHAGLVYVSGQLPIVPQDGRHVGGSVEDQTRQVLSNVGAILEAAGSGLPHVLTTTVYISDIALWPRVNAVWAEAFGSHRPARAVVPARELHHGLLVEIQAIAALRAD